MTYYKVVMRFTVDVAIKTTDDTTWRQFEKVKDELKTLNLSNEHAYIVNATPDRLLSEETYEVLKKDV